jgi:hypothetical protein
MLTNANDQVYNTAIQALDAEPSVNGMNEPVSLKENCFELTYSTPTREAKISSMLRGDPSSEFLLWSYS